MPGKDFIVSQDLDQAAGGSDLSWRTIDSAPKDGTWILLFMPHPDKDDGPVVWASWVRKWCQYPGYWRNTFGSELETPTHWMRVSMPSPNEPPEDKSRATDKLTITHELGPDGEVRLVERRAG